MEIKGTLFTTSRCRVRPFLKKDINRFMEYRNNLDWMIYQGFKGCSKEEYLERLIVPFNIENHSQIAITDKNTDALIGDLYVKMENNTCHIGYTIHPLFARQGFAYEAATGLIKYLQDTYQNIVIKSGVSPLNIPSIKLLEKLGFVRTGKTNEELTYLLKK